MEDKQFVTPHEYQEVQQLDFEMEDHDGFETMDINIELSPDDIIVKEEGDEETYQESDEEFEPSPEPRQNSKASRVQNKSKGKGRSFGAHSSRAVKNLRSRAENGDIDSAIKIGWGQDRITKLYNRNKMGRGVRNVRLNDPIDDPAIVTKIETRKERNRGHQQKRAAKLRVRAEAGDAKAGKDLGWSDKTIDRHQREWEKSGESQDSKKYPKSGVKSGVTTHGEWPSSRAMKAESPESATLTWTQSLPMRATGTVNVAPPSYPMPPPEAIRILQMRAEYEHAEREASLGRQQVEEAMTRAKILQDRANELRASWQHVQGARSDAFVQHPSMPPDTPKSQPRARKGRAIAELSNSRVSRASRVAFDRPSNFP